MALKKIINNPDDFVDELTESLLLAHPDRLRAASPNRRALVRADAPVPGKVGIVTGGGSGHLPLFLGYVGLGLATGVAIGNVFFSLRRTDRRTPRLPRRKRRLTCTATMG